MNTDWIAIQDPVSGKTYYANSQTRATQWEMPSGFNGNQQPQIIFNQQSQINMHQQPKPQQQINDWKQAHDPSTGSDYWYNTATKQTTWTMPAILSSSVVQFDNVWGTDSDNEDDWDQDDEEDSSSGSELEVYNPAKQAQKVLAHSFVADVTSSEDNFDEKIGNPMDDIDEDEVLVSDTSNKYWDIAQTQGHKYALSVYADQYFQKNKHNKIFKKTEVCELLKYAPYNKVKHALTKMDAKLDKQAQQIWKNINSFMGLRKSSKAQSGHIDKLLRFALKSPEAIRDEIFCQLCKQTNCNPSVDSLLKGWKLMSICCCIFPPSDEFVNYFASYLWSQVTEVGVIGKYAEFALRSLDRTMEVGQRRVQPIPMEIERIKERQAIPIKIYFLDGTFKNLLVTAQTRAQQIEDALSKVLRLNHSASFGLFEMEHAPHGWTQKVYANRQTQDVQQQIDGLQHMPLDRELESNERVMDVISSWMRSMNKKNRNVRLIFKCKVHSAAQENSYSFNDWKLAFLTAVYNVISGMYPLEDEDVWHLAALQLQGTHGFKDKGNNSFYSDGIVQDVMDRYVPYAVLQNCGNIKECELKILAKHGLYKHLDKVTAYRKYIEYLRKTNTACVYFGNVFFRCVRVTRLRNKQKLNGMFDLVIGISENGILLMDPVSLKIVERYKMEEIITYGFRSNAFLLVAGTLMTQRRFQFATMVGKQMNDLLRQHIELRVLQAEAQGYAFQH